MRPTLAIEELVDALAGAGLEHAAALDEPPPLGQRAVIRGRVALEERALGLRVWVPANFPLSLPTVFVEDHDALGFVPHLTASGAICYHEGEGSVQSIWRPAQVIVDALQLALKTLRQSLAARDRAGEIVEEMEWWWSRQRGCWRAWTSLFKPGEQVKAVRCVADLVLDNKDKRVSEAATSERGLYLPLQPSLVEARLDPRELLVPGCLRKLVWAHLAESDRKLLRKRLSDGRKRGEPASFVVLGVPRPSGDRALIIARFEGILEPHPLQEKYMKSMAEIEPILVDRSDRRRLLERGGANPELEGKRVAVVGVGAVGGYVAEAMARTGIGELVLVDPDILEPVNMYRHTLGCPRLSQVLPISTLFDMSMPVPKAQAMGRHIKAGLPYLQVHTVNADIMSALNDVLRGTDLVLVAVGAPTLSRGLNLELCARGGPRAVYTWLEPLGVGGHALLTAPAEQPGCYECLFADEHGEELLAPRTDFVAPNQDVLRRIGGCGMSYTPFSDLDARRTAELAARLVVAALTGVQPGPCLRSWRGDPLAARARGLEMSARHQQGQDQLDAAPEAFVHDGCRICGE